MLKKKYSWLAFILFSVATAVMKFRFHELWKDEWQAYLVARDQSIGQMLLFLNYEGHPSLWYLYLKLASVFGPLFQGQEDLLIQSAHFLLVVAMLYIFFIKLKLPLLWKILFAAGYFIFFEYGIVNRGYIFVMLLSFWTAHLIKIKDRSWKMGIALFLLCQTEVYGVFIAGGLVLYMLVEESHLDVFKIKALVSHHFKILISLLLGVLVMAITVFPRGNEDDFSRAYLQDPFSSEVVFTALQGNLANAYLPGSIVDTSAMGWSFTGLLISLALLCALLFIFSKNKPAFWSFLAFSTVFFLFNIVIFTGGIRQWGMIFIFFICLLSISYESIVKDKKVYLFSLLAVMAVFQIIHNSKAVLEDVKKPFSNAIHTGHFIKDKVPEKVPVVVINKFETAPVGGYADRPLYELPSGTPFTFFKWLEKVYIPTEEELHLFTRFKKVGGIIILSPTPLDSGRFPNAQLWESFEQPSYKQENYYLYTLALKK